MKFHIDFNYSACQNLLVIGQIIYKLLIFFLILSSFSFLYQFQVILCILKLLLKNFFPSHKSIVIHLSHLFFESLFFVFSFLHFFIVFLSFFIKFSLIKFQLLNIILPILNLNLVLINQHLFFCDFVLIYCDFPHFQIGLFKHIIIFTKYF